MRIERLRTIDIRLLMVCSGIHCRQLTFKEMWNLRKFQLARGFDEQFLRVTDESLPHFKYPSVTNVIREIGDMSPFMW